MEKGKVHLQIITMLPWLLYQKVVKMLYYLKLIHSLYTHMKTMTGLKYRAVASCNKSSVI